MTTLNDDFAPRPDASKRAAAQHRARETEPLTAVEVRRSAPPLLLAAATAVLLVALLIVATYQLSGGRPMPLQLAPSATTQPTDVSRVLSIPVQPTAPTSTPVLALPATPAPIAPQNGAGDVPGVFQEAAAQSGRGLGVVEAAAPPTYIEVVAAQAPHVIRGGVTGPCDGACAAVPTLAPEQAEVIRQQVEHKVR